MTESREEKESRDASHEEDAEESPVRKPGEAKTEAHGGEGADPDESQSSGHD